MPFDYSWVDWTAGCANLLGFRILTRHKRTKAWWWRFGVPLLGPKFDTKKQCMVDVECFLCKSCHLARPTMEEPIRVAGGSRGVPDHFRKLHYITYRDNANDATTQFERDEAMELLSSNDPKQQAVYNRLAESCDPDVLRKDIFRWIVYDYVPFEKVASPYFKKIVSTVYPVLKTTIVPNPRTISRWVVQEFPVHKQEIRENMKTAISSVHLAFDLWTSKRHKAINGITANWVDRKGHCQTALLAMKEMSDRHSGVAIAQSVVPVIADYGFADKLGFFVLNNASSNDTCIAELAKRFDFDPLERRLRCIGHIFNLIAQELLYNNDYEKFRGEAANIDDVTAQVMLWRKQGPIGMIAQIVRWVNKSPGRIKRFEDAQLRIFEQISDPPNSPRRRFTPLKLLRDNSTRYVLTCLSYTLLPYPYVNFQLFLDCAPGISPPTCCLSFSITPRSELLFSTIIPIVLGWAAHPPASGRCPTLEIYTQLGDSCLYWAIAPGAIRRASRFSDTPTAAFMPSRHQATHHHNVSCSNFTCDT